MKGFRTFLMQGNILDLAVAVVIGVAFNAIVQALASRNRAATDRQCPECLSTIPIAARRCMYCTAVVPQATAPVPPEVRKPRRARHGFLASE
jgi:hypothetical protein